MTRLTWIGCGLALAASIAAVSLWWEAGAWQYGDLPTRGLARASVFALAALGCHGLAYWLRRKD